MILAWLTTVWGKRLLLAGGILAVLLGARWYFLQQGEARGRAAAAQEAQVKIDAERVQNRQELEKALDQSAQSLEDARQRFQMAQDALKRFSDVILQLSAKRATEAQQIAKIPDSSLHEHNVSVLGLRAPNDTTQGYLFSEERAIASCLSDHPLCQEQNKSLDSSLRAATDSAKALADQNATLRTRDTALISYANKVEHSYIDLYNSIPRKRNWFLTILTFGIKGKPKPLPMPSPLELEKSKPVEVAEWNNP